MTGAATDLRRMVHRVRNFIHPPPLSALHPQTLVDLGVVTVGRHTYPSVPTVTYHAGDTAKVRIGSFCSIAAGAQFVPGGNHPMTGPSTFPLRIRLGLPEQHRNRHPWSKGDIIVGNDVWIGNGALVLGGVTIADGAVIAARAVVTKDVEPYTIVGGNPARPIGRRITDEQAGAMQRIAWWEWPDEVIAERADELEAGDVDVFIARYSRKC